MKHLLLSSLVLFLLFGLVGCTDSNPEPDDDSTDTTYRPGEITTHPGPCHDTVFEIGGIRFAMRYIPGGTFYMGASNNASSRHYDVDAMANEGPVHSVTLGGFLMADCEVSQALYLAAMGVNPSQTFDLFLPVHNVSYYAAQRLMDTLRRYIGYDFRLPTEAEWEYAARGGCNAVDHPFSGSDTLDQVAWYVDNADNAVHPCKSKAPNGLGLYDMSGNVMEWCSDWCGDYSAQHQSNPQGPEKPEISSMQKHVVRGGSFKEHPFYLRNTARQFRFPSYEENDMGIRIVLSCATTTGK